MTPDILRHSMRLRHFDPEMLAGIVNGGRFEHHILTRAPCHVRHRRAACGSFSIDTARYSFPFRASGSFAGNFLAITYFRRLTGQTWMNGFHCGGESLQLHPAGSEVNCRLETGAEWVAIEMDERALQAAALERVGRPLSLPWTGTVDLPVARGALAALDRAVRRFLRPSSGPDDGAAVLGALAEAIARGDKSAPTAQASRWRHRHDLIARADSFLQAHGHEPFRSAALAAAVGATERSLQQHFAAAYGLSPARWARCRALHHARQRLLGEKSGRFTVESIARDSGFRHMGRFASYYRELFGEHPSDTMARARR
jgi:AraC-like DNA-binding protein